ncbi:MAG: MBL fold metallo-hydrolase [Dissulfurispiraceae bacterium]
MSIVSISLQSGSNGNCIYVETEGVRLLFDAGICGIQAQRRLESHGRDIREVDAVIISHDHGDHIRYAGVYERKYDLPIYVTRRTLDAALSKHQLGPLKNIKHFSAGGVLQFGNVAVYTIPTKHDGADGAAFVIASGKKRLGILTDLGHVCTDLERITASLDAVFIESNYDQHMLINGPYPAFLKKRIQGPGGHLSNIEAAELLRAYGHRLQWACLAHLSEQNNDPVLAMNTHRSIVNPKLTLYAASRHQSTGIFDV